MGNKVREKRLKQRKAQSDLAEYCSVSRQSIHAIEAGKLRPTVYLAIKISRFLNLKVEEVFFLEDQSDSLDSVSRFSSFKYKVNYTSYLVCLIFCIYSIVHCLDSIPSMGDEIKVSKIIYKIFAWPIVSMSVLSFNWTYKFLTTETKG